MPCLNFSLYILIVLDRYGYGVELTIQKITTGKRIGS